MKWSAVWNEDDAVPVPVPVIKSAKKCRRFPEPAATRSSPSKMCGKCDGQQIIKKKKVRGRGRGREAASKAKTKHTRKERKIKWKAKNKRAKDRGRRREGEENKCQKKKGEQLRTSTPPPGQRRLAKGAKSKETTNRRTDKQKQQQTGGMRNGNRRKKKKENIPSLQNCQNEKRPNKTVVIVSSVRSWRLPSLSWEMVEEETTQTAKQLELYIMELTSDLLLGGEILLLLLTKWEWKVLQRHRDRYWQLWNGREGVGRDRIVLGLCG